MKELEKLTKGFLLGAGVMLIAATVIFQDAKAIEGSTHEFPVTEIVHDELMLPDGTIIPGFKLCLYRDGDRMWGETIHIYDRCKQW